MRRFILSIILSILCVLVTGIPVLAVSNPDSITLHTAKVFENIFETGDMLFVASYDIDTTDNTTDSFLVNLIDDDGTTLLFSRTLSYLQYNVSSVYATASQVTSLGLVWESDYVVRVTGNPAMFGSLVEDTNMDTRTLAISDYNADGTLTSLQLLQSHCIDIAEALESDWGITLLTTTSTGKQVLNSTGAIVFLDAIPGLDDALPDLFQLSSSIPNISSPLSGADYAIASKLDARLGTDISDAFSGIGSFLGIGENSAAGLWAIVFILTVASIVFLNTGNSMAALVLAIPIVVLMTYVGAIPEAITYVLAIFVAIYAMYFFWLRGT